MEESLHTGTREEETSVVVLQCTAVHPVNWRISPVFPLPQPPLWMSHASFRHPFCLQLAHPETLWAPTILWNNSARHGSPVSGWRLEPDAGPYRQTVAIRITFSFFFLFFSVIFLWSYSLSGPGMDVAEASKHGKKSTSQKLEDQKKVGRIFFEYCLHIALFYFYYSFVFGPNRRSCVAFLLLFYHMSFSDGYAMSVSSKSESAYCWFVVCVAPQLSAKLE